ncbi:MAG: Type 1 glutamine amidotransferase-like domain-containing protein, partial [Proteobacteria bacterium]|nr:Type 1 glutamine amidotransferase-like domain-containing protein [Pseudomonadota bacterium]
MIGVLAIQGNFESHCKRLTKLKQENILVKTTDDLNKVKGLIIPGGESSVLLKLLTEDFKDRLVRLALDGLPIFGTCAGVILLAK